MRIQAAPAPVSTDHSFALAFDPCEPAISAAHVRHRGHFLVDGARASQNDEVDEDLSGRPGPWLGGSPGEHVDSGLCDPRT